MFANYTGYLLLAMTAVQEATVLTTGDGQTDRHSNYIRALETLAELLQYYEGGFIVLSIVRSNYQNYKAPIHSTADQRRAVILVTSTIVQFGVSGVKSRMEWCVQHEQMAPSGISVGNCYWEVGER